MVKLLYRDYEFEIQDHGKSSFTYRILKDKVSRKNEAVTVLSIEILIRDLKEWVDKMELLG
jgi:hypothetical protein